MIKNFALVWIAMVLTFGLPAAANDIAPLGEPVAIELPVDIAATLSDLAVTERGIFLVTHELDLERGTIRRLFFRPHGGDTLQEIDTVPGFLSRAGDLTLTFDARRSAIVFLSATGRELKTVSSGFFADLVALVDGTYLGVANISGGRYEMQRRRKTPAEWRKRLAEVANDLKALGREVKQEHEQLAPFDVFHVGKDMSLEEGMLTTHRASRTGRDSTSEERIQNWLEQRHLRASADGVRAVAFKLHRPEIVLFEREGDRWESHALPAPGKGLEVTQEAAQNLGLPYPTETRLFYQRDVLVGPSSILVSDPSELRLVEIGFDGSILKAYDLGLFVIEMEQEGGHLYLRTRENGLLRFESPPPSDAIGQR